MSFWLENPAFLKLKIKETIWARVWICLLCSWWDLEFACGNSRGRCYCPFEPFFYFLIWHLISEQRTEKDTEECSVKRARAERRKSGESSSSQPPSANTDSLQPAEGSTAEDGADGDGAGGDGVDDEGSTKYIVKRISSFVSETEPYILDVDLDFFSCKNPFKELYTQVRVHSAASSGTEWNAVSASAHKLVLLWNIVISLLN